ncbi:MAG: DNA-binding protein [Nanoarchaeota archaeon]
MSNNNEIEELQKQILLLENNLRNCLSKDALSRYFTIKTANPEFALQAGVFIVQAVNQKYLNEKLSDEEFKGVLRKLQENKKGFRIIK